MERRPAKPDNKTRQYERPRGGMVRPIGELMPEIGRTAFRKFGFIQSSVVIRRLVDGIRVFAQQPQHLKAPVLAHVARQDRLWRNALH